jgi:hypothetical protein
MKTKTFFLVCLLIGMGLPQLLAQDKVKQPNRSYVTKYHNNYPGFYPVFVSCDGLPIDILNVTDVTITSVFHNVKNESYWEIDALKYTAVSLTTGETFKGRELDRIDYHVDIENGIWIESTGTWRENLMGDRGSRYIVTIGFRFYPDPDNPENVLFGWWEVDSKCF